MYCEWIAGDLLGALGSFILRLVGCYGVEDFFVPGRIPRVLLHF